MDVNLAINPVVRRQQVTADKEFVLAESKNEPLSILPFKNQKIKSTYTKLSILGQGTYGVVYQARKNDSNQHNIIALKKLHLGNVRDGVPSTTIRELTALKYVNCKILPTIIRNLTPHKNIVNLYDFSFSQNQLFSKPRLFLELEYCHYDLRQFAKRFDNRRIPFEVLQKVVADIVNGTLHCHNNRLIHRDLKPSNILIKLLGNAEETKAMIKNGLFNTSMMDVKLADFGLARIHYCRGGPLTHEVITLWYRAPEILLGADDYGPEVDVWSVGCILAELLTGAPLFNGATEIATLYKMFEFLGTPTEVTWPGISKIEEYQKQWPNWKPLDDRWARLYPDCSHKMWTETIDFLDKTLRLDPKSRCTIQELIDHPLIRDFV